LVNICYSLGKLRYSDPSFMAHLTAAAERELPYFTDSGLGLYCWGLGQLQLPLNPNHLARVCHRVSELAKSSTGLSAAAAVQIAQAAGALGFSIFGEVLRDICSAAVAGVGGLDGKQVSGLLHALARQQQRVGWDVLMPLVTRYSQLSLGGTTTTASVSAHLPTAAAAYAAAGGGGGGGGIGSGEALAPQVHGLVLWSLPYVKPKLQKHPRVLWQHLSPAEQEAVAAAAVAARQLQQQYQQQHQQQQRKDNHYHQQQQQQQWILPLDKAAGERAWKNAWQLNQQQQQQGHYQQQQWQQQQQPEGELQAEILNGLTYDPEEVLWQLLNPGLAAAAAAIPNCAPVDLVQMVWGLAGLVIGQGLRLNHEQYYYSRKQQQQQQQQRFIGHRVDASDGLHPSDTSATGVNGGDSSSVQYVSGLVRDEFIVDMKSSSSSSSSSSRVAFSGGTAAAARGKEHYEGTIVELVGGGGSGKEARVGVGGEWEVGGAVRVRGGRSVPSWQSTVEIFGEDRGSCSSGGIDSSSSSSIGSSSSSSGSSGGSVNSSSSGDSSIYSGSSMRGMGGGRGDATGEGLQILAVAAASGAAAASGSSGGDVAVASSSYAVEESSTRSQRQEQQLRRGVDWVEGDMSLVATTTISSSSSSRSSSSSNTTHSSMQDAEPCLLQYQQQQLEQHNQQHQRNHLQQQEEQNLFAATGDFQSENASVPPTTVTSSSSKKVADRSRAAHVLLVNEETISSKSSSSSRNRRREGVVTCPPGSDPSTLNSDPTMPNKETISSSNSSLSRSSSTRSRRREEIVTSPPEIASVPLTTAISSSSSRNRRREEIVTSPPGSDPEVLQVLLSAHVRRVQALLPLFQQQQRRRLGFSYSRLGVTVPEELVGQLV
jgi:hypothetical protein